MADHDSMDHDENDDRSTEGGLPDLLKRAINSGVKGFLKSEENIRSLASDIWHSEKVGAVGATISNVREEVIRVVGREIVKYLEKMNLTDEIVKVLTAISLEVKTEIRFIPNDKKLVTPDVKADVKVKRTRK